MSDPRIGIDDAELVYASDCLAFCRMAAAMTGAAPRKGDVVLAKVKGRRYLHLVTGMRERHVQISNNKGGRRPGRPARGVMPARARAGGRAPWP